uniref:Uncharacterized protein n=1 Tax=Spironucleus salmonicida TaxID=348837 RepID=V6LJC7_9EUKA|eukprot:EST43811.1 Hypothetical protein SS50377_16431 [Spironucleus salmonicida]
MNFTLLAQISQTQPQSTNSTNTYIIPTLFHIVFTPKTKFLFTSQLSQYSCTIYHHIDCNFSQILPPYKQYPQKLAKETETNQLIHHIISSDRKHPLPQNAETQSPQHEPEAHHNAGDLLAVANFCAVITIFDRQARDQHPRKHHTHEANAQKSQLSDIETRTVAARHQQGKLGSSVVSFFVQILNFTQRRGTCRFWQRILLNTRSEIEVFR